MITIEHNIFLVNNDFTHLKVVSNIVFYSGQQSCGKLFRCLIMQSFILVHIEQ